MLAKLKTRPLLIICMIIAGIVPMEIASLIITRQASATMEQTTFDRLRLDVETREASIESLLNTSINQNGVLSMNPSVQLAMKQFTQSFKHLTQDLEPDTAALSRMRSKLRRFYEREFLPKFGLLNKDRVSAEQLLPKTRNGLVAQYLYIADNDNPVGQKDELFTADGQSQYTRHHTKHHKLFRDYVKFFEYYDIYLIEPENGNVVYSVHKETEYGTNLFNGPYRNSGLASVAQKAMTLPPGEVAVADYGNYTPSYGLPAAFVGAPVYDDNKVIGVLAFQLPAEKINMIMSTSEGLGETGESMLLGEDHYMRSQSRFAPEPTILRKKISTDSVEIALTGKTGTVQEEMDGVSYLSAYAPVNVDGINWAIVARIQKDEALSSVMALRNTSLIIAGVSALIVTLFAFLLGLFLHRALGGDPTDLTRIAKAIGNGDLTDNPGDEHSRGAYAQLVEMRSHLRQILDEANHIAQEVKAGASELSEGNMGLSERTEQQAANLEETGSSTEELTSTVKQNAENARSANELAINTRERAISSGETATRAITAMQEISSASERIADIIGVIDEIAFQTNLLALNAAVEAARAGEQGRGFAVVASEVRQLAGRSASAAKEIKELIEDSVHKVKDGAQLVGESSEELEHIVTAVSQLTDIVGQITVASDEQAIGIEQINQALVHMDSVTQQNAALVEEATGTSQAMSEQATQLSSHIGYFSANTAEHTIDRTLNPQPTPGSQVPNNLRKPQPLGKTWQAEKANQAPAIPDDLSTASTTPVKRASSGGDDFWDEF